VAAVVFDMVLFRMERLDDTRDESVSVDVDTDSESTGSILENGSSGCGVDECGGRCTSMSVVWGCGMEGRMLTEFNDDFNVRPVVSSCCKPYTYPSSLSAGPENSYRITFSQ
jgi:hypothetical protein